MTNKQIFYAAAKTPTQKLAIVMTEKFQNIVKELQYQNADKFYIEKVKAEALAAMEKDLVLSKEREIAKIKTDLQKIGTDYAEQRRRTRHEKQFDIQEARDRFAAMTPKELEQEATHYIGRHDDVRDPQELDILSAAVKAAGLDVEYDAMRQEMANRDYRNPYKLTGEGKALSRELQFLETAQAGDIPITIDGKTVGYSIGELLFEEADNAGIQ